MSDTGGFVVRLTREWKSSRDDTTMRCYVTMRKRVTVLEFFDYLTESHPHVDPWAVELNFGSATWDEPSTEEDRAQRLAWRVKQAEREETWERETYERLRAKFAGRLEEHPARAGTEKARPTRHGAS